MNTSQQFFSDKIAPRLLSEIEAAKYIGMSRSFLRQARMDGARENRLAGPPHIKLGKRCVRYELNALNEWIDQFKN